LGQHLIIEADGGSRGNPGTAGSGAVVIDAATGQVVREVARYIGVGTNNVAEYVALLAGLEAAHEINAEAEITVRMDSKLVIEQMSGGWKIKHPDMISGYHVNKTRWQMDSQTKPWMSSEIMTLDTSSELLPSLPNSIWLDQHLYELQGWKVYH